MGTAPVDAIRPRRRRRRSWWAVPEFEDNDDLRAARVLGSALWLSVTGVLLYAAVAFATQDLPLGRQIGTLVMLLPLVGAFELLRRRRLRAAAWTTSLTLSLSVVTGMLTAGGVYSPTLPPALTVILLGGLVLGWRAAGGFAALFGGVLLFAEIGVRQRFLPMAIVDGEAVFVTSALTQIIIVGVLAAVSGRGIESMLRRLRSEQRSLEARARAQQEVALLATELVACGGADDSLEPALRHFARAWGRGPVALLVPDEKSDEGHRVAGVVDVSRSAHLTRETWQAAWDARGPQRAALHDDGRLIIGLGMPLVSASTRHGVLFAGIEVQLRASADEALLVGAAALFASVLASRNAVDEAQRAEARRASMVKLNPALFATVGEDGILLDVNPAFERFVPGKTGLHLIGRSIWSFETLVGEARAKLDAAFAAARAGSSEPVEIDFVRPGAELGVSLEMRVHYVAEPSGGRYDILALDIGSRREAQRRQASLEVQLADARRLEALGQLAGGIAHDFNNMLTIIQTNSILLAGRGDLAAEAHEMVSDIVEAAKKSAELTSQLLTFARRQERKPQRFDLAKCVGGLEKLLRRLLPSAITLDLDLQPGATIVADPRHLEQAVVNLVANARDAMPDGGRCLVRTTTLVLADGEVPDCPAGKWSELVVQDTGVGMDEETRKRVFEPLFTTKAEGLGTGLGLATVHGVVTGSGGSVTVQSAPGRGTRLRVLLPHAP